MKSLVISTMAWATWDDGVGTRVVWVEGPLDWAYLHDQQPVKTPRWMASKTKGNKCKFF